MGRALGAALAYFLLAYAAGFALGAIRVLAVAPHAGETVAVLIEAPFLLAASWFAAGWSIRRFGVPRAAGPRAVMGGAAFLLLTAAEFALAWLLFARPPAAMAATYATAPGAIGLAAQLAFGLIPLVRR